MKLDLKRLARTSAIIFLGIAGCTSSDIYVPVNSSDLIDESVEYRDENAVGRSETVKVDIEPAPAHVLGDMHEENILVITPPPATEDETVDFVYDSYAPDDFDDAVRQAQMRRGINPAPVPALRQRVDGAFIADGISSGRKDRPAFEKKLDIADSPAPAKAEKSVTFLSTVIYHSNTKADISARDMKALREVAKFAKSHDADVRVVGHASSRTKNMLESQNKAENFGLSIERADAVKGVLARQGIPADRIWTSAVSDTERVVDENMPINESINRRTEIYISY